MPDLIVFAPDETGMLPATNTEIERAEDTLLNMAWEGSLTIPEYRLEHKFAPGIYIREIFMPAGSFIIGHEHKTEHFNVILQGVASVMIGGNLHLLAAPHSFVSGVGVRKVLHIHEDMIWQTIHANPENLRDISKLEAILIHQSVCFQKHLEELQQLKSALESASHE